MIRRIQTFIIFMAAGAAMAADPPRIVATPPADAGRGLVRVSEQEIRHYSGAGAQQFLQSKDNGETWNLVDLPQDFPPATCMSKESPAYIRNPHNNEFLRVEPLYRKKPEEGMWVSEGGLDGSWSRILNDSGSPILPSGILRSPLWVNHHQRILIPGHGGGCFTHYSDDQGKTWKQSNKINSPAHQVGGVHKGTRWNHGMVEATIVELKDRRLWMIARTAQDQHYESFSEDYGTTWSEAKPSRFWGTITMPTIHRLKDGRLLFLWSNTTALPEVERSPKPGGEDVFTNRDAIHAAISEDEGRTWSGFRELILDEYRNNEDYAVTKGSNDRGKHQSEIIQLDDKRVLFSCGQHSLHRRLMILEIDWLDEKQRISDLSKEKTEHWSTHQFINQIVGHCGYNRKPGAQVENGALRVRRVDDESLTNPNQGATWNFPSGNSGSLHTKIRLERGGSGIQLCLANRWFNPTDDTVDRFANFVLTIDGDGQHDGKPLLTPGKEHTLLIKWAGVSNKGQAEVHLDGKPTGITLPGRIACPNGISYVHFYNPATTTDPQGFSILATKAVVD